ncbi:hypothetical protein [Methanoplanus limicola]|uniref:Uncharacterized protein n=1 Tax=Methanoplanus limicola DSM 2279 TaxID=937775 RepID=H1YWS5_9EURY|nr:hypothetical protein [Methanoplanus limicola]EHQ36816.1 hypothetical protein Metlim_2781 [Methanoplanus limicola DSM 2279]
MTVRIHEQKNAIERINQILKSESEFALIAGELNSLGFIQVSGTDSPASFENRDLELYVRMYRESDNSVIKYELLTFEEIEKELNKK